MKDIHINACASGLTQSSNFGFSTRQTKWIINQLFIL